MARRALLAAAVVVAVGLLLWFGRPVVSTQPVGQVQAKPQVQTASTATAAVSTGSPTGTDGTTAGASLPAAVVRPAPQSSWPEPAAPGEAPPGPPSARRAGSFPMPTTGKPMAPVDIAWEIDGAATVRQATITVTNRGGSPAALAITLTPRGARIDGPAQQQASAVAVDAELILTATVVLDDPVRAGSLIVEVAHTAQGTRGRTVSIDLPPAGDAADAAPGSPPRSPPPAGEPLQGTRRVVDAHGRGLVFMPASATAGSAAAP